MKTIKEKISIILARNGWMEHIWHLLFKLHLDATSKKSWGGVIRTKAAETRNYYKNNRRRIVKVISLLSDQRSKEIYRNQIKYRSTYKRKYSKPYNISNQYFPDDIIRLKRNETFIDCGAFVGDTVKKFEKKTKGNYVKIVCFEPDLENFKRLRKNTYRNEDIVIYNQGCWKENTVLKFDNIGSTSSAVSDAEDAIEIQVCSLDRMSDCLDASFIKMDIEGAEYNALLGAEEIIKKNRPVLAVCIYHSDEDMLRLPEMISAMCKDYFFYVRQHSFLPLETVFYAVPFERGI